MKKLLTILTVVVVSFLGVSQAHAAIAFDATSSAFCTSSCSTTSGENFTHVVTSSGSNTILIIGVIQSNQSPGAVPAALTSVKYNSVAMTLSTTTVFSGPNKTRTSIYYLVNPSTGSNTVNIVYGTSPIVSLMFGESLTGVNQSNPVRSASSTSLSSTQSITAKTTSVSGDYVTDFVCQGTSLDGWSNTLRILNNLSAATQCGTGGVSSVSATTTTTFSRWTMNNLDFSGDMILAIAPASATVLPLFVTKVGTLFTIVKSVLFTVK